MRRPSTFLLAATLFLSVSSQGASRRHAVSFDACRTTVSPAAVNFQTGGGHATVAVVLTGNCAWSPVSTASWITAAPAAGSVSIDVAPNGSGAARTGLIHVRSAVIVVTQTYEIPNLLTNGGFDSGIAGWSNIYSGPGSAEWRSSTGAIASPGPSLGAAAITSTQTNGGYQLSQCIPVNPNSTYDAGVKMLIPSGQSQGKGILAVYLFDNPGCQVAYFASKQDYRDSPTGSWFTDTMSITTDSRTRGFFVVIGAGGADTPPFTAWFDDAYLRERK